MNVENLKHLSDQCKTDLKLFDDKIKRMDVAASFNKMTIDKKRKDMGIEAFRIWIRIFLKKLVKPEYYILAASNIMDIDLQFNQENAVAFGKLMDEILAIIEGGDLSLNSSKKMDNIITKYFPNLFRKRYIDFLEKLD